MKLPKVYLIQPQLAELLADYESLIQTGEDLVALARCLKEHNVSPPVIKAIENIYIDRGVELLVRTMNDTVRAFNYCWRKGNADY